MIKKICDLVKIGDNYILQPRRNDRLEEQCIITSSNHNSEYFNTEDIFDLRSSILNKGINNEIHFYLMLFDENMREISLDKTNCKKALIFTFNREKVKRGRRTVLNYNPRINSFNIDLTTNLYDKNILYLGNSERVTMKQIAFESSGCFNSFYSENGGGYYGFQIGLEGLNKQIKQGILFGYDSIQNVMNRSHLKNNIQRVIDYDNRSEDIPMVYATPIPTAPPQEDIIIPTAPLEEEVFEKDKEILFDKI